MRDARVKAAFTPLRLYAPLHTPALSGAIAGATQRTDGHVPRCAFRHPDPEARLDNTLVQKLARFVALSEEEKSILARIVTHKRTIAAKKDIIAEDDKPEHITVILEGFACRYKHMENGERQITAYLIPGDFCDLHVFLLDAMDHNIGTLSRCTVANISREDVLELTKKFPAITAALWMATLVDAATLREWLANIGRRSAAKRLAHLLCELLMRLEVVGHVKDDEFDLPITQIDLADTTGLTHIHVNRSLTTLRKKGLISLKRNVLTIHDPEGLMEFSEFNPNYLHLAKRVAKGALLSL